MLPLGSIVIVTMAAVGRLLVADRSRAALDAVAWRCAFPTTWAMDAFNDLMIRRQTASAVTTATLVLLAYAAAYLVIGLLLFRHRANDT